MEKKNFITLVMSVVGGMLFSLGMCMCLVSEWNMFNSGVVVGAIGAVELLITWMVYRKMSGKQAVKLNAKTVGKVIYGIFSALVFGVGMCMVMAFEGMMIQGIIVGIVGIVLLLCLVPMCVGLKDSSKEVTE
ncbi:MAG: hypothetical protein J6A75_04220 [Lachnospiraceae bacterium]|nr:hypothetical protein [Lachnospiraceae bacterium]